MRVAMLLVMLLATGVAGCFPGDWEWTRADAGDSAVTDTSADVSADSDPDVADPDVLPEVCRPPPGECSPLLTNSCPFGQGCVALATGRRVCTVTGGAGWLEHCAGPNDCTRGFACMSGQCIKLCCRDTECRDVDTGGNSESYCSRSTSDEVGSCLPTNCNRYVLSDNGCPSLAPYCGARGSSSDIRCVPHSSTGIVEAGGRCTNNNNCLPGYSCISLDGVNALCARTCNTLMPGKYGCPTEFTCAGTSPDGFAICLRRCDLRLPSQPQCPAGQTCHPVTPTSTIAGVCAP